MTDPRPLIVIGRFPPPLDGQALATQRFVATMGHHRHVLTVDASIPAEAPLLAKWSHYRRAASQARELLDAHPDATVVWQSISPTPVGHWRDRLLMVPLFRHRRVIAVVHWGSFARVFASRSTARSARRMLDRLERIVFTQQDRSEACAPWVPESQRAVIPNSLVADFPLDTPERADKLARKDRPDWNVLFLANMLPEKGYGVLAAAARIVLSRPDAPRFRFRFAGAWPTEAAAADFRASVADLGDAIEILGGISDRNRIRKLHQEADVFVLPSWLGEAQPLSIIEALSHATPVIVADHGGMPAMIRHTGAGRIVPPKDAESLAQALLSITEAGIWTQHAEAAAALFDREYDPGRVEQQWLRLLEEVEATRS